MSKRMLSAVVSLILASLPLSTFLLSQEAKAPFTFFVVIDISLSMDDRFPAPVQTRLTDATKLMDVKRRLSLLVEHLPENTRVLVTIFDHRANQLCDLQLDSATARDKLRQVFASIKTRNGSTHLWRTADAELARAQAIAQANPEHRVRVLLYTDGNDMEKASGLDHQSIIRKYGESLQSAVQLDWITIGFDLHADIKRALEQTGVNFTRADTPENIDPLIAGFKFSPSTVTAGQEVRIDDESVGVEIVRRTIEWGDDSAPEVGDDLAHRYAMPGNFEVRYTVTNAAGRTDVARRTLVVGIPPATPAKIQSSHSQIVVGQVVTVTDASGEEAQQRQWTATDGIHSSNNPLAIRFKSPGKKVIRLQRTNRYGQKTEASVELEVLLPPPPNAAFRLATKATRPGEPLVAISEASESAARFEWSLDGHTISTDRHLTLPAPGYGEHLLSLSVWDSYGQSHRAESKVDLPRPEKPVAAFRMPDSVAADEGVEVLGILEGLTDGPPRWFVNDREAGTGEVCKLDSLPPGEHRVRLVVAGPGGEAACEKLLVVRPHQPPRAEFTIGNESPFVGDVITITSTANGPITESLFTVTTDDGAVQRFTTSEDRGWFELACEKIGVVTVSQTVSGPGGTDELVREVLVSTRAVQPAPSFIVGEHKRSGQTRVQLLNESRGSIDRFELDPCDGTTPEIFGKDCQEIEHTYSVGTWIPRVIAYPAEDTGLTPAVWVGPEIVVAQPTPEWLARLFWQLPVGLLAASVVGVGLARYCSSRVRRHQKYIRGDFYIRAAGKPRELLQFTFEGANDAEVVQLEDGNELRVFSVDDGVVRYMCQLLRDGQVIADAELEPGSDVSIGDYSVNYMP